MTIPIDTLSNIIFFMNVNICSMKISGLPRVPIPDMPKVNLPELPRVTLPDMPSMNIPNMNLPDIRLPNVPDMNIPDMNRIPMWQQMTQIPRQMWQMMPSRDQLVPQQMQQMMNRLPINPMNVIRDMGNRL